MNGHLIQVDALRVRRRASEILKGVSFSVGKGEIYALLGGNGAGKSTTLQICLGLLRADTGDVRINGTDPSTDPEVARKSMAYLPENVALYEHLNAIENLRYFLDISGDQRSEAEMHAALDAVGLPAAARSMPLKKYSKGMKQKTAIGLAVLRQTPVLLLDEPTSGLDPAAAHDLNTLLVQRKEQASAVLMVTHDLLGAAQIADRIGLLAHGKMVKEWTAASSGERFDVHELHHALSEGLA